MLLDMPSKVSRRLQFLSCRQLRSHNVEALAQLHVRVPHAKEVVCHRGEAVTPNQESEEEGRKLVFCSLDVLSVSKHKMPWHNQQASAPRITRYKQLPLAPGS